ncbi:dimethylarginine dimethylaminohydrolase family protein [Microtetraspora fusca]|uniref:dimethylarginine dimethylaminohydrolase family protein n=1 Tax=Microtetraspora fusca TaxID=1997 RepID=UPI00082F989D|nr:arginine deiminase family protein [Microtetraspora fusca]
MSGFGKSRVHDILGPEPEPGFHDTGELTRNWGAKWGAADEVGPLRTVLMRRPNPGLARISADAWDDELGALVDPGKNWYWFDRKAPDLDLLHQQYEGYVAALRAEGVEVVFAPELPESFTKSIYTRDPLITVPGGAVITRLAPRMRRGEERSITATVASAGMPVLGTVTGTGIAEGGSFVKLNRDVAAYGTSIRCNREGLDQIRRLVEPAGVNVIEVPLPGYLIHIDGAMVMIDHDLAMVNSTLLPYEFLTTLRTLGIETVEVPPGEEWAVNSLTVAPRRVMVADHLTAAADLLSRHDVEVVPVAYSEITKNGGSLHCSTMELRRDW